MKYKDKIYPYSWRLFGSRDKAVKFRFDPVPGTGKFQTGNLYRTMKTTQEHRWNCAHKKYTRGKRRKVYLPDAWCDIPRSNRNVKSWKDCTKRKKQYKEK